MHEAYCAIKLSFVLDFFNICTIYGLVDVELPFLEKEILSFLLFCFQTSLTLQELFLHQNICKVSFEITDFSGPCEKAFLYCVINFLPKINSLFTSQWVPVSKVMLVIIFLFHMPVYSIS